MSEEIIRLRTKLNLAETRFEDLKHSFDARGASAEIVELPKPRRV
jgi:hypothetical protein